MKKYLTVEDVIFVHDELLRNSGEFTESGIENL